jgi:hypothetical protein
MKIKNPVLLEKQVNAIYEVDVEGVKIQATYNYSLEDEMNSGWEYDLSPCHEGLTDDEIEELEDEFTIVLDNLEV